jgi:hypothetical protein
MIIELEPWNARCDDWDGCASLTIEAAAQGACPDLARTGHCGRGYPALQSILRQCFPGGRERVTVPVPSANETRRSVAARYEPLDAIQ